MNCINCYYNFDGVCASHVIVNDLDTYGRPIKDIMIFGSIICEDYKNAHKPQFEIFKAMGLSITLSDQE